MKKFFILLSLFILSTSVWSQEQFSDEDQYPETDPAVVDGGEFTSPRGLPATDYEEVPREEQEFVPEPPSVNDDTAPEEVYEADEEFLE
jgi:hypothetical protein